MKNEKSQVLKFKDKIKLSTKDTWKSTKDRLVEFAVFKEAETPF
jgi:hypothetical protein